MSNLAVPIPDVVLCPANPRQARNCVFRSMWAPDSIRSGHQFLFDVGSKSVVMWAAFSDLP